MADFPVALQLVERLPKRILVDLLHPDVVELQKIDVIGLQPFERGVGRAGDCFRRKILWNLALPAAARPAVVDEIVPNFRCDNDFVPLIRESFRDQLFA